MQDTYGTNLGFFLMPILLLLCKPMTNIRARRFILENSGRNHTPMNHSFVPRFRKNLRRQPLLHGCLQDLACWLPQSDRPSGERFDDIEFLNAGVENYYKFLTLKPKAKEVVLVPTYQIDLMWHTHILS
jgi:Glycine-rich domain-containing protein-like